MKTENLLISIVAYATLDIGLSTLNSNAQVCFTTATNLAVGTDPRSVISADFNGDGKADLATANMSSNNVSVLLGDGMGGFSAATNFGVAVNPYSVTSADFNGDSIADLAVATWSSNCSYCWVMERAALALPLTLL